MKATRVQAIFISDNADLVHSTYYPNDDMSADEKATYQAMLDGVAEAQQQTGATVEVYEMNLYSGNDVVWLERWNINRFPAVRLWAEYPDGVQRAYNLQSLTNAITTSQDVEDIRSRLIALINGAFGEEPLLCKIFPIICDLGGWAWLALTAVSALNAYNSQNLKRAAWLAATGYCGYNFFKGGGFQRLMNGTPTAQIPASTT